MPPEIRFIGLHKGQIPGQDYVKYQCETCGLTLYLKPYVRVDHSENACEDVQADGLTTLRPPSQLP